LRTRSWEDKEGNKKFATEVVGDNLIMLDKRSDAPPHAPGNHEGIEGMGHSDPHPSPGEPTEDLPF
jgi:single-strand DNA-binding protein